MRKNKEYVPQFEYLDSNEQPTYFICKQCGSASASLNEGICFSCLKQNEQKIKSQLPNYNKHMDWQEERAIHRAKILHLGIIFYPLFKFGYATILYIFSIGILFNSIVLLLSASKFDGETIIAFLELVLLAGFSFLIGILLVKFRNKRIKKNFVKFNNKKVRLLQDGLSWICPCCNNINETIAFCETCGVFPKIEDTMG